jgi:hypothetical protein
MNVDSFAKVFIAIYIGGIIVACTYDALRVTLGI